MLPMGLKLNDFTKVNKLIFTTLPFNLEDELIRDNKIFGIKLPVHKTSIKNKAKSSHKNTKKKKL